MSNVGRDRQLARPSSGDGEPLRLRPAGVESRPDVGADCRGVDAADVRRRSGGRRKTVTGMLRDSWPTYENYTGPLGIGTLTDIIGVHFGPASESSERNGWGQWHRADEKGVGMDRTVATGTGFIGQYSPAGRTRLRVARDLPGRAAAVHASRAVHTQASIRKDGDSAHLRPALSGRRPGGWVRRALEDARRARRRRALRRSARSARVPGRARHRLARRGQQLVPARILHSR